MEDIKNKSYDKIDFNFDIPKLQEDLSILLENVPISKHGQICITHRANSYDPYYEGCGNLLYDGDFSAGKHVKKTIVQNKEEDFDIFNKELENTYLYTVYTEISKHFKIARMRINVLNQKQCLTWHADNNKRIHVPIITDEKCKFVLEDTVFHIPADGSAYIIDTTKWHSVFNGSRIVRIHLVSSIIS